MDKNEFETLVAEAMDELPQNIRDKMDNVAVVIEDWPTRIQMSRGGTTSGHLLLGLYEGVPRTKRGPGYTMALPDKITIFQKSIEAIARTRDAIKQQVRETVWHEFAHHFGFDEGAIHKLSSRRRRA